jgi:pimeloyl-ACP methyl ester carboxylesterase
VATFILVHGTFAQDASWTDPTSPMSRMFSAAAIKAGTSARFERVVWSGKNRLGDRQRAVDAISSIVQDPNVEGPLFLIGHSHGGSVIAYYLRDFHPAQDRVRGCVFLSTPFIALRQRAGMTQLVIAATMVIWSGYYCLVSPLLKTHANLKILADSMAFVVMVGFYQIASLEKPYRTRIERDQTVYLPQGNYLFLRASGDEASAALSFAQFAMWMSNRLSTLLLKYVVDKFIKEKQSGPSPRFFRIFFLQLAIGIVFAGVNRSVDPAFELLVNLHKMKQEELTFSLIALVVFLPIYLFSIFFVVLVLLIAAWPIIQAVASRVFGWTGFVDGLMVDMSVEPVPYGTHVLEHIPWDADAGFSRLMHSSTYEHEVALSRIRSWFLRLYIDHDGSNRKIEPQS